MSVAPISLSTPQVTPKQIAAVGFGLIVTVAVPEKVPVQFASETAVIV